MSSAISKGAEAEEIAARYLVRKGLYIRERNFLCRLGEIDIIAQDSQELIFAEVRLRNHSGFGSGADSVTTSKQRKLARAARYYLLCHGTPGADGCLPNCRFDVLSLRKRPNPTSARWHIEWIQNAFEVY